MKQLSLLLLIIISTFKHSESQPAYLNLQTNPLVTNPESNFTIVSGMLEHYFDSLHTTTGSQSLLSGEKAYIRWKGFWANRNMAPGVQPGGDINAPAPYLQKLASGAITTCNTSPNGAIWSQIGPVVSTGSNIGMVNALAVAPNDINTIYAGTASSGLWKTTNKGVSWSCISDNIRMPAMGVTTIDVDPQNAQHILFATSANSHGLRTSFGNGIYETFNGGSTWVNILGNNMPNPTVWQNYHIGKFVFHPTNRNIIYAIGSANLYKLVFNPITNSWTVTSSSYDFFSGQKYGPLHNYLFDLEIEQQGNQLAIFVSSIVSKVQKNETPASYAKLFVTYDEGGSWNQLSIPNNSNARAISIEKTSALPSVIFASVSDYTADISRQILLYKSSNNGQTWQSIGSYYCGQNGSAGGHVLHVSDVDPNTIFFGESTLWKSTNGQITNPTFTEVSSYANDGKTHADINALVEFHSSTQDVIVIAHDGGVSLSNSFGSSKSSFQNINGTGLAITQFFSFDFYPETGYVIGGCQDNGTQTNSNNGNWSQPRGGDGGTTLVNSKDPKMYLYNVNYDTYLSKNNGANTSYITPPSGPITWPKPRAKFDPNDQNFVLIAENNVYRYNITSNTFTPSSDVSIGFKISAFDVSERNPNIIIAASENPWGAYSNFVLKSIDGGASYIDLTPNLYINGVKVYDGYKATEILIDPQNANRIFMSFDGFRHDDINNNFNVGVLRVIKSEDGGLTWQDMSSGLSAFPVNCLVYQEGTNDVIYAGTDLGVYRWNKLNNRWDCYNSGLPLASITELKIDNCAGKIKCSTYGRGIWEANLMAVDAIHNITSNTIWGVNTVHSFATDVRVQSGVNLTINGLVSMAEGKKIIIEKGAKIFVNGGVITNRCGGRWHGILVEGDPKKDQIPSINQGFININSGSKISNAFNAVSTLSQDYVNGNWVANWSKTGGGIIIASNSVFTNNYRHIELLAYNRPNNNNDLTSFTNCTFEVSGSRFVGPNGTNGYGTMITAYGVKGVRFNGCDFLNTNGSQYANIENMDRGTGILSLDASIIVDGIVNHVNCTYSKYGSFYDLSRGIYQYSSPSFPFASEIKRQNFERNDRGLWMENIGNISIHHNNFNVYVPTSYYNRVNSTASLDITRKTGITGIYSKGASGYRIEQNAFYNANGGVPQTYIAGQLLAGSIMESSTAGKFRLNNFANLNAGTQSQLDNMSTELTCNQYQSSELALRLNPERNGNTPYFGECLAGSANQIFRTDYVNTFVSNASLDLQHKPLLSPTTANNKIYVRQSGQPNRPNPAKVNANVTLTDCSGIGTVVPKENCPPTPQFQYSCTSVAWPKPGDAKIKYQLGKQGLIDTKNQITNGTLVGDNATSQLNHFTREVQQERSNVLWGYSISNLYDSTANYTDSVIAFLLPETDIESRKMLVATYYYNKQYTDATQVLSTMSTNEGEGTAEFKTWYTLLCQAALQDRNVYQLNEDEWATITQLSTTQTAAANSAQGLLTLVKGYYFHPYIEKTSETGMGKKEITGLNDNLDANPTLILYPNPADGNVTILYTLQPNTNHNYIRVTDIVGRVLYEKNCDSTGKALELNTATFNNGTYFIELYSNKSLITTKTILINH